MLSLKELDTEQINTGKENTILISPAQVDDVISPELSGVALLDALASITDATKDNPYKIEIERGSYDLGTQTLRMKPFVDIEGEGQENTSIISKAAYEKFSGGTIEGADFSELRQLTVICSNPDKTGSSSAVTNVGASPKLTQVTCIANGPFINYAIVNKDSLPVLTGVTVIASGFSN